MVHAVALALSYVIATFSAVPVATAGLVPSIENASHKIDGILSWYSIPRPAAAGGGCGGGGTFIKSPKNLVLRNGSQIKSYSYST